MPVFLDDKGNMQLDEKGREKLKAKLDYYNAILEMKETYGEMEGKLKRICSSIQDEVIAFEKQLWNDELDKLSSALQRIENLVLEAQECINRVYKERHPAFKETIKQIIANEKKEAGILS